MRRLLAVSFMLALTVMLASGPIWAEAVLSPAEQAASDFVTAFQKGQWKAAAAMADEAALSWVEYIAAREGSTDGISSIMRVESAITGESTRAKVYYANEDGEPRVRYLKLKERSGKFIVVDDKMIGRDWISSSYKKGLFATVGEISGVRLTVLGFLEVSSEIKIDLLVENVSAQGDCYIYPSIEAFYMVSLDGATRQRYFAAPPAAVPESPIAPGKSMRTYAIFPYWASDPSLAGRQIKSLSWTLFVPYGPVDQFAVDYM